MNNITKEFLRTVRLKFPVFQKNERRFFNDLTSSVNAYTEQFPSCTLEDLHERFGEPDDIVTMYYNHMESGVYVALMKNTRYIKAITVSTILFIAFLLTVIFCNTKKPGDFQE